MSDLLRRWSSRTSTSSDGSDRTSFVKFDLSAFAADNADAEGTVDNNNSSNNNNNDDNNKKAPEGPVIDLAKMAAGGEAEQSAALGSPKGHVSKAPQAAQSSDSLQVGNSSSSLGAPGATGPTLEEAKKGSGPGIAIDLTGARRAQRQSEPAVRPSRGGQSMRSSTVSEAESEWWSTNGGIISDPLRDSTTSMRSVQSMHAGASMQPLQRDQRLSTIDTFVSSSDCRSTVRSLPPRVEVSDPVTNPTSYCSSVSASADTLGAPSWTSFGTPKESARPQDSAEVAGGRGVKGLLRSTLRKTTRGAAGMDAPNEEQRSTKFRVKFADDQTTENEPQRHPSAELQTGPAKPPGSPGLNVPNPKPVASWFPHAARATTSSSSQWQPNAQANPKPAEAGPGQQASTQRPSWMTSRNQPPVEQAASQAETAESSSFMQASYPGAPSGTSASSGSPGTATGQNPPPSTKPLQMDMARKSSSSSSSLGSQGKPVVQNVELAIMSPHAAGSSSATPLREAAQRDCESHSARPAPRTGPPSGWSSPNLGVLERQEAGAAIQGPYFDPQVCAYYSYSGKWADDVCAALRNWKTCFVCCFPPAWAMRLYTLLRRASPFDVRCPCCGGRTTVTVTAANSCIFALLVMASTAPSVGLAVLACINPAPKAYVELLQNLCGKAAAPVVRALEVIVCVLLGWLVTGLLWAWMLLSVGRKFHIGKAVSRCGSFMCEACCCPCIVNVRAGMHVDRTQGFLPVQESVRRIIELTTKVQKLSAVASSSDPEQTGQLANPAVALDDGDDTEILLGLADLEEKRRKRSILSVGSAHGRRH